MLKEDVPEFSPGHLLFYPDYLPGIRQKNRPHCLGVRGVSENRPR